VGSSVFPSIAASIREPDGWSRFNLPLGITFARVDRRSEQIAVPSAIDTRSPGDLRFIFHHDATTCGTLTLGFTLERFKLLSAILSLDNLRIRRVDLLVWDAQGVTFFSNHQDLVRFQLHPAFLHFGSITRPPRTWDKLRT
jgi:hypothetical protein